MFDDVKEIEEAMAKTKARVESYENKFPFLRYDQRRIVEEKIIKARKFLKFCQKRISFLSRHKYDRSDFIGQFNERHKKVFSRRTSTVNQINRKIGQMEEGIEELTEEKERSKGEYKKRIRTYIQELDEKIGDLENRSYKLMKRQFNTKHPERYKWKQENPNPKFLSPRRIKIWKKRAFSKKRKGVNK